ncbi:MAG: carbohydrate-binding domain-containing protein [Lactovum sp.]
MKKRIWILISLISLFFMTACSKKEETISSSSQTTTSSVTEAAEVSSFNSVTEALSSRPTKELMGDEGDKEAADQSYDLSEGTVTITKAGIYYFIGTNEDAQIIVEAPEDAEVTLILNGVNLTSKSGPVILGITAEKIKIKSPEGAINLVSDSTDNIDSSAIDADTDLTFNGKGTIVVSGLANHGIKSSDDLKITNGLVYTSAINDALIGTDSVIFEAGTAVIEAGDKGVKSDQDNGDTEKSLIQVIAGLAYIQASGEGMSAATIDIQEGEISIVSGDDAVNASSQVLSPVYKQTAGTLSFVSGGDGIDSNGTINITGGTIIAIENSSEDNEPIDSESLQEFSGVTLLAAGTNNAFPETESQSYVLIGAVNEGETITIEGIGEFIAPANLDNLILSTPKIESGTSYNITVASINSTVIAGQGASMGMGNMQTGGMGMPGFFN